MYKLATAIYHNNALCLEENYNFIEGEKFKVIILDKGLKQKQNFFDFVKTNQIKTPIDYTFNREELNER
jgi:hypothetical protein